MVTVTDLDTFPVRISKDEACLCAPGYSGVNCNGGERLVRSSSVSLVECITISSSCY